MWKNINGRLVHTKDESRIKFRTSISESTLRQLEEMSETYDTYINYLLENGMSNLLLEDTISYNKKLRPKDRVQYQTSYDKDVLSRARDFAKRNGLYINDVIEHSVQYIDFSRVKKKSYRSRIE